MNKNTPKYLGIALVALIMPLLTGCPSTEGGKSSLPGWVATPTGKVEQVLPERQVARVTSITNSAPDGAVIIMKQTNFVVLPPVYYTNYALSSTIQTGLGVAGVAAAASGVPWADLAVKAIGGLGIISLGWLNFAQKRKLRDHEDTNETLSSALGELVDNVNTVKSLVPATLQNDVNQRLQQSQVAAGPDVAAIIRDIVSKR